METSHFIQWKLFCYTLLNIAKWKTNSFLYKDLTRLNLLLPDKIQSDCDICTQKRTALILPEDIRAVLVQLWVI